MPLAERGVMDRVKELLKGNVYTTKDIELLTGIDKDTINSVKEDVGDISKEYPIIYTTNIKIDTIVDGEGWRDSVYCSFCNHKCALCHNEGCWGLISGEPRSVKEIYDILIENEDNNVTFSGGDPFYQYGAFNYLAKMIRDNTNKTIWCYTGFKYEDILKDENKSELLENIDVLVDGRFEINKRDESLRFKGSSNQRIINVKESLRQNKVIEEEYI